MRFRKIRSVTLPVLKLAEGVERFFKFVTPMYVGKQIDDKKEPATLAQVIDLETGEEGLIIIGAVLRKELEEAYPNDAYRGKCFAIANNGKRGDKKYNSYSVSEIAEPEPEPGPTADPLAPETGTPAPKRKR